MAKILNKMLNFVGWEADEEEEIIEDQMEEVKEEPQQPQFMQSGFRKNQNKVVSLHQAQASQLKVVIVQPQTFDDSKDICDHLKNKKPIVINLEDVEKEVAQRIIDFLSGSVYALDGNIQKVANGILLIAPYNVDIMGDVKEELRTKGVFSWAK